MTDALTPYCGDCDAERDIEKATVGGTNPDGTHDIKKHLLECGHVIEPDSTIDVGLVYLLSEAHPQAIEVDGEIDQDILDEHLDSGDDDLGWRGYLWEGLGMLMAVYIVLRDKIRSVRKDGSGGGDVLWR